MHLMSIIVLLCLSGLPLVSAANADKTNSLLERLWKLQNVPKTADQIKELSGELFDLIGKRNANYLVFEDVQKFILTVEIPFLKAKMEQDLSDPNAFLCYKACPGAKPMSEKACSKACSEEEKPAFREMFDNGIKVLLRQLPIEFWQFDERKDGKMDKQEFERQSVHNNFFLALLAPDGKGSGILPTSRKH